MMASFVAFNEQSIAFSLFPSCMTLKPHTHCVSMCLSD